MGVPQFFHWLVTHYNADVLKDFYPGGGKPEYLFLDYNCGIHPAAKKKGIETMEEMYQSVCNYLETVVKQAKPTKLIYIAIDGVAPMAKMRQQRFRRFKAIQDEREKDKIKRKYKCWEKQKFDFNMISPGTVFMKELTERLNVYLKNRWGHLKVILDDASNPGEGEHKIMAYIRNNVPLDGRVVVYGLDSDLIFLSLLHHRPNFCLLREKIFFGHVPPKKGKNGEEEPEEEEPEFNYLDVSQLRKIVISMMNPELNRQDLKNWQMLQPQRSAAQTFKNKSDLIDLKPEEGLPLGNIDDFEDGNRRVMSNEIKLEPIMEKRLILDYVALSFILGNDFLPYLPHLKIKDGGLNQVIECYKEVQIERPNSYLVQPDGQNYNHRFLRSLMRKLADLEIETLKELRENASERIRRFKTTRRYRMAEGYDQALMEWEYIENQYDDKLRLGDSGWKSRYYMHYLKDDSPTMIKGMIENFLEGLTWILQYYQGDCPSWGWSYLYRVAPSVSCILQYLEDEGRQALEKINLDKGVPVRPEEQLLMILPPQSNSLLEPQYGRLMTDLDSPISFQYPINFKIDMQGHRFRWECYPILPPLDPDLVKLAVSVIQNPVA